MVILMLKRLLLMAMVAVSVLMSSGTSNAFLRDRGGGLIHHDDLDVTWLQDANYAQTSGYDDGLMNWYEETFWVGGVQEEGEPMTKPQAIQISTHSSSLSV